jgi:hypothetical protein
MFHDAVKQMQSIGGVLTPIDWSPFALGGRLLYDGTFVSERLASLPDDFLEKNGKHLHPVIRELFEQVEARNSTAVQAYRDLQAKALYTRQAEEVLGYSGTGVDIVLVPTTVTHWKTEELLADPIKKNSQLGVRQKLISALKSPLLTCRRNSLIAAMSLISVLFLCQLASTTCQNYLAI